MKINGEKINNTSIAFVTLLMSIIIGFAGIMTSISSATNALREDIRENGRRIDEANKRIDKAIELLSAKIDKTNERILETNTRIDKTNERILETNTRIDKTNEKINETNTRINDTNERILETNTKINNIEKKLDIQIFTTKSSIHSFDKRINALETDSTSSSYKKSKK